MKQIITLLLFTVIVFNTHVDAQKHIEGIKHVIVIGVDGMSPNGIIHANTPNMDFLMKNGSYTLNARGVLPTVSSPNWASMIMGAGPEQHGITSNDWERDEDPFPPIVTGKEEIFPTIFSVIREQKPNAEIGSIYHWGGFGRLFEKSVMNYDINPANEKETASKAADYIISKKPDFTFIHLDHVDGAGHEYGHGTDKYFKSIELADSLIGVILGAIRKAKLEESSIVIVTADHGGIGYGHGGETLDEIEIPFIIYGKGIKKDHRINQPVFTYDNAATVAFAFNLKQPYAWIGRPVIDAFVGLENTSMPKQKNILPQPVIHPAKNLYSPAGGLFIDVSPKVKIDKVGEGVEVRYTLDGSVPTKNSLLYTNPVELKKSAIIQARSFKGDNEESQIATAYFRLASSKSKNGINYKYFEVEEISSLPVFEKLTPSQTGTVYEFRIDSIKYRDSYFAIQFESFLKIEQDGEYKFYTLSDDGSKLYIDGKEVVDNDGSHGTKEKSDTIKLKKGLVPIKVTYYNGYGGKWLDVFYRGPGIPKQIIPADKLFLSK